MGSKWFAGGVVAAPHGRIQFDFTFEGVRYRPSIQRPPSEANLRRAHQRLNDIKRQMEMGADRRQLLLPSCCLTRIGYRVASVRMLPH
jgi:hypothetical protein